MFEKAADRLTVEVIAKKSRLLRNIVGMLTGDQSVAAPENEIQVKDRATSEIVYRESIDEGPHVADAVKAFEHDLEWLGLEAFCEKYGIEGYPPV